MSIEECENEEVEFDNPWSWFVPHTCLEENICSSGFDIGIDEDGDALIHHSGHVGCMSYEMFKRIIEDAREEVRE